MIFANDIATVHIIVCIAGHMMNEKDAICVLMHCPNFSIQNISFQETSHNARFMGSSNIATQFPGRPNSTV